MVTRGGLRERKKQMTREAIEAAALDLFERQGFDHTTVDEIAAEAGISPRTFFRYYESKENVVLPDPRQRAEVANEALRAQPPGPPQARLAAAMSHFARWIEEHDERAAARARIVRGHAALVSRSLLHSSMAQDSLAVVLAETEGRPTPELRHRVLATTAVGVVVSATRHWRDEGQEAPLSDVVTRAFETLGWAGTSH
ncbi:MAG TPA: TetR family transcriptional regulator [Acidimicrobiales bacterium]|nr:TetR family transcriptional regulator [Acidimicrobiales bacterium]